MGFIDSVKTCYSKYIDFGGKASRSEFWWFFLASIIIGCAIAYIFGVGSSITSLATLLLVTIPSLSVGARRLRDAGFSPWWLLLALTGIGTLVLLIMWAIKKK